MSGRQFSTPCSVKETLYSIRKNVIDPSHLVHNATALRLLKRRAVRRLTNEALTELKRSMFNLHTSTEEEMLQREEDERKKKSPELSIVLCVDTSWNRYLKAEVEHDSGNG